jgi:hypothetical protein
MATVPINGSRKMIPEGKDLIKFEDAMEKLSRDDRFRATILCHEYAPCAVRVFTPRKNSNFVSECRSIWDGGNLPKCTVHVLHKICLTQPLVVATCISA